MPEKAQKWKTGIWGKRKRNSWEFVKNLNAADTCSPSWTSRSLFKVLIWNCCKNYSFKDSAASSFYSDLWKSSFFTLYPLTKYDRIILELCFWTRWWKKHQQHLFNTFSPQKHHWKLLGSTHWNISYLHSFHFSKMASSISSVWVGTNLNSDTSSGTCSAGS